MRLAGRRARLLAALVLAAAILGAFEPVRSNGFVDYDDGAYITKNPEVLGGLTAGGLRFAFGEFHSANWHPLTWLSHMLDVELFRQDAGSHHLVNALLHALNGALLFLFLSSATGSSWASLVVALLFALHPLRVESVAWASERKDVLSSTFFFAALAAYAAYVRRRGVLRYGIVVLLFALGLLAKPMLVTLPLVLLLLDVWPLERSRREGLKALCLEKVPFFLLALASGGVTIAAQRAGEALRSFEALPLLVRVENAFLAYGAYLVKSVWPSRLAVFYPHPGLDAQASAFAGALSLAAVVLFLAASVFVVRGRERRPWLFVGWGWYVIMALPVIGILQVGAQWMADRYTYLPTIGASVALVFGLAHALSAPRARTAAAIVGIAFALAFVPFTRRQIAVWKDTRSLFEHALGVTERNYVAHLNLGFLEQNQENLAAAEAHYLAALEIAPRSPDAFSNLGGLYYTRREYDRAREHLERALALDPSFLKARLNLGLVRRALGDPEGACAEFRAALARAPENVDAAKVLAEELVRAGRPEEALAVLSGVLARRANALELALARAELLAEAGRAREALADLERLIDAPMPPAGTLAAHAWLRATSADPAVRDPAAALRAAQRALAEEGSSWKALRALAAALAAAGDFERAAAAALEAASSAPAEEEQALLELYRRFKAGEALFE